jgi:hypothetical protein
MGQREQSLSRISGRVAIEVNDACSESTSTIAGLSVSGQVTVRGPRYLENDRTNQRTPRQRPTAIVIMTINEPTVVSMFSPLSSTSNVCLFGSLLLDLFDPGTKPRANFSLELCLVVLELQVLDGFSFTI